MTWFMVLVALGLLLLGPRKAFALTTTAAALWRSLDQARSEMQKQLLAELEDTSVDPMDHDNNMGSGRPRGLL